ncbi:hypothetical protein [uncultured Slackia sp.]|uniref:hypothetical protein n=1 Tax=uncultured Slackia sp. TaxID=665903 RepID=UPI0025D49FFF|nr:hypothetical protein [uncultured Slackia sp.]
MTAKTALPFFPADVALSLRASPISPMIFEFFAMPLASMISLLRWGRALHLAQVAFARLSPLYWAPALQRSFLGCFSFSNLDGLFSTSLY